MLPDKSLLMPINDAPVVPLLKPNTQLDPGTESVPMPSSAPITK